MESLVGLISMSMMFWSSAKCENCVARSLILVILALVGEGSMIISEGLGMAEGSIDKSMGGSNELRRCGCLAPSEPVAGDYTSNYIWFYISLAR